MKLREVVPVRCPTCGEQTPLEVGTWLGSVPASATADDVRQVMQSIRASWRQEASRDHRGRIGTVCSCCQYVKPEVYWLDMGRAGGLHSPLCWRCLSYVVWKTLEGEDGLETDIRVFSVRSTEAVYRRAMRTLDDGVPEVRDAPVF